MKLIRCYIENFGGLQQYSVDFNEGLTVIHEPNGFGKTTLAEFIRAMFYGFPRANKDITKNPRLKYLPWQGGRYGGYLIFEHNGKRYRIDRTFGEAPKGDKFKLTDEDTHRESKDFTTEIGSELFGLDGDSFLRSTYMPQLRDNAPLTTDNIRAKLGNLLEDTGDLGNYEKALQRLKDKRTVYEHFRGNGGSIHEAQRKITALQQDIAVGKGKQPLLEEVTAQLTETRQAQEIGDGALRHIRQQLSEATTAEAEAALAREYASLCANKENTAQALDRLLKRYPQGVPTVVELEAASERMDKAAQLNAQLQETHADRTAAQTVAEHKDRFAEGIPTSEDFAAQRAVLDGLMAAKNQLQHNGLTQTETQQLAQLQQQFAKGVPSEELLTNCRENTTELTGLQHSRPALELPKEDKAQLESLDRYFAQGIPESVQIEQAEQKLNRADELRRTNLQLSAALPAAEPVEAAPKKKLHTLFLPALILGILSAAAGIYLLVCPVIENNVVIGGICTALGVVALLGAALLQFFHFMMSKMSARESAGMTAAQRSIIDENERTAAALEAEVADFLRPYSTDSDSPLRRRLAELSTNRALYLPLLERSTKLARQAADQNSRMAALTEALHKTLSPYFDTILNFHTALQTLELRKQQYEQISHKQQEIAVKNAALTAEIAMLEEKFSTFLSPYCGKVDPKDFRQALDNLRRDADSFTAAAAHLQQRETALAKRDAAYAALCEEHLDFCTAYGLTIAVDDRQALKTVERDAEAINRLSREAEQTDKAFRSFVAEHGHKPATELPSVAYDLEGLKLAEQELLRQQNARGDQIWQLEQRRSVLRMEIDRVPALMDELTKLTEQKAADTESRRLLDSTVDFLQKARESLSASYLGGVQGHFAGYLNRLTGEETNRIAVNTDLEVQLERAGSARSLPHFSAGQTDAVHLCMRLALSDALFENGNCFMILDDPFVNLDDHHTAQALALLEELSADRQIVYLVCNSSRAL